MNWMLLFAAGIFEVAWAVSLKYTDGFTRFWPSVGTLATMVVSFLLLGQALKTIPLGTGYAVWTGIGVVGTTLFGILVWNEPHEPARILCLLLIIGGISGLRLLSAA